MPDAGFERRQLGLDLGERAGHLAGPQPLLGAGQGPVEAADPGRQVALVEAELGQAGVELLADRGRPRSRPSPGPAAAGRSRPVAAWWRTIGTATDEVVDAEGLARPQQLAAGPLDLGLDDLDEPLAGVLDRGARSFEVDERIGVLADLVLDARARPRP